MLRSAGACPPRSLALREKRTRTQAVSLSIVAWRGKPARMRVWHARAQALR